MNGVNWTISSLSRAEAGSLAGADDLVASWRDLPIRQSANWDILVAIVTRMSNCICIFDFIKFKTAYSICILEID